MATVIQAKQSVLVSYIDEKEFLLPSLRQQLFNTPLINLPYRTIFHIFSYVGKQTLGTLPRVNKIWQQAIIRYVCAHPTRGLYMIRKWKRTAQKTWEEVIQGIIRAVWEDPNKEETASVLKILMHANPHPLPAELFEEEEVEDLRLFYQLGAVQQTSTQLLMIDACVQKCLFSLEKEEEKKNNRRFFADRVSSSYHWIANDPKEYHCNVALFPHGQALLGYFKKCETIQAGLEQAGARSKEDAVSMGVNHFCFIDTYCTTLYWVADFYGKQGEVELQEECLFEACKIAEKVGSEDPHQLIKAGSLEKVAEFYEERKELVKAMQYYGTAFTLYNASESYRDKQCMILNKIGQLYLRQNLIPQAINAYLKALTIKKPTSIAKSTISHNVARAYMIVGSFEKASQFFDAALQLAERRYGTLAPDLIPYLFDLGNCYFHLNCYGEVLLQWERIEGIVQNDPQIIHNDALLTSYYQKAAVLVTQSTQKLGLNLNG